MKVEFLGDISRGGHFNNVVSDQLIRFYDFDKTEAGQFQLAIQSIIQNGDSIDIHELPFVIALDCSLKFTLANEDIGVTKIAEKYFECLLTQKSYEDMIHLVQPFVDRELSGYQWLYDGDTEIDLLFSPGGTW